MKIVECNNLKVTYDNGKKQFVDGLDGLSTKFISNRISLIFGDNGSGKTTLFDTLVGLLPYDGEILFDGVDASNLSIKERKIAYVRQNLYLFPKMTVFDNLAYPLKNQKLKSEEITKRIYKVLETLEISHLMNCLPKQISIGQFQKVCLAKAIVANPNIIILDEAFSNIDKPSIELIKKVLKEYVKENDAMVLYATHDSNVALEFGDYFYIIDKGRIIYEGENDKNNYGTLKTYLCL